MDLNLSALLLVELRHVSWPITGRPSHLAYWVDSQLLINMIVSILLHSMFTGFFSSFGDIYILYVYCISKGFLSIFNNCGWSKVFRTSSVWWHHGFLQIITVAFLLFLAPDVMMSPIRRGTKTSPVYRKYDGCNFSLRKGGGGDYWVSTRYFVGKCPVAFPFLAWRPLIPHPLSPPILINLKKKIIK